MGRRARPRRLGGGSRNAAGRSGGGVHVSRGNLSAHRATLDANAAALDGGAVGVDLFGARCCATRRCQQHGRARRRRRGRLGFAALGRRCALARNVAGRHGGGCALSATKAVGRRSSAARSSATSRPPGAAAACAPTTRASSCARAASREPRGAGDGGAFAASASRAGDDRDRAGAAASDCRRKSRCRLPGWQTRTTAARTTWSGAGRRVVHWWSRNGGTLCNGQLVVRGAARVGYHAAAADDPSFVPTNCSGLRATPARPRRTRPSPAAMRRARARRATPTAGACSCSRCRYAAEGACVADGATRSPRSTRWKCHARPWWGGRQPRRRRRGRRNATLAARNATVEGARGAEAGAVVFAGNEAPRGRRRRRLLGRRRARQLDGAVLAGNARCTAAGRDRRRRARASARERPGVAAAAPPEARGGRQRNAAERREASAPSRSRSSTRTRRPCSRTTSTVLAEVASATGAAARRSACRARSCVRASPLEELLVYAGRLVRAARAPCRAARPGRERARRRAAELRGRGVTEPTACAPCAAGTYEDGGRCWWPRAPRTRGDLGARASAEPGCWRTGSTSAEPAVPDRGRAACLGAAREACKAGYRGIMCGVCDDGYYYSKLNDECMECGATYRAIVSPCCSAARRSAARCSCGCRARGAHLAQGLRGRGARRAQVQDPVARAAARDGGRVVARDALPAPFHPFLTAVSTVTEAAIQQVLPLGCAARYSFYTHLLVVTLVPAALTAAARRARPLPRGGRARRRDRLLAAASSVVRRAADDEHGALPHVPLRAVDDGVEFLRADLAALLDAAARVLARTALTVLVYPVLHAGVLPLPARARVASTRRARRARPTRARRARATRASRRCASSAVPAARVVLGVVDLGRRC